MKIMKRYKCSLIIFTLAILLVFGFTSKNESFQYTTDVPNIVRNSDSNELVTENVNVNQDALVASGIDEGSPVENPKTGSVPVRLIVNVPTKGEATIDEKEASKSTSTSGNVSVQDGSNTVDIDDLATTIISHINAPKTGDSVILLVVCFLILLFGIYLSLYALCQIRKSQKQ